MSEDIKKVVLAYSGGLDTSVILRWLIETYKCEVIAFVADIGQKEELDGLREKALNTGAAKVYIDDLQEEFVRDFVFPALRANAIKGLTLSSDQGPGHISGVSLANSIWVRPSKALNAGWCRMA